MVVVFPLFYRVVVRVVRIVVELVLPQVVITLLQSGNVQRQVEVIPPHRGIVQLQVVFMLTHRENAQPQVVIILPHRDIV